MNSANYLPPQEGKIGMKHFRSYAALLTALAVILTTNVPAKAASTDSHFTENAVLQEHNGYLQMAGEHRDTARISSQLRRSEETLPASYDLRTEDRVTPVKDQLHNGTCWAFGALSSAESSLLTMMKAMGRDFSSVETAGNAVNLSEKHLVWFAFHGKNSGTVSQYAGGDTFLAQNVFDIGGSRAISVPTLARWYGAAAEKDLPYTVDQNGVLTNVTNSSLQTVSRVHLQDADYLPEPVVYDLGNNGLPGNITYSSGARDVVKECIQNRGAVSVGYHSPEDTAEQDRFYKNDTCGYYCNDKTLYYPNHEVSLVGWDDHYSRDNFVTEPQGDGAWLVKNSWGTSKSWESGKSSEGAVGQDGYFYLSYYDLSLSEPTFFSMENTSYAGAQTKHTYSDIYQYDGTGMGASQWSLDTPARFANTFTARSDMKLQAVSVQVPEANSSAAIDIYVHPSAGNPTSGGHMASLTCHYTDAGYYTKDLGSQGILLNKGDTFSIVEQVSYADDAGQTQYCVLLEAGKPLAVQNYGVDVACSAGQSYYSYDGSAWKDQGGAERLQPERGMETGNATIKAFSNAPDIRTSCTGQVGLPLGSEQVFTVTSSTPPRLTCGNGSTAQMHVLKDWDPSSDQMQLAVYGCGRISQSTGVYATYSGKTQRLFTVSLQGQPFVSDTTMNVTMHAGQTYTFCILPKSSTTVPSFTVGDSNILSTGYAGSIQQSDGRKAYYFRYRCLRNGSTGIYISIGGKTYRIFVCTVK